MTQDEQKYYDLYFDLFNHEGWKIFEKALTDNLDNLKNKVFTLKESEFEYNKGYAVCLANVARFKDLVTFEYEAKKKEESDNDSL